MREAKLFHGNVLPVVAIGPAIRSARCVLRPRGVVWEGGGSVVRCEEGWGGSGPPPHSAHVAPRAAPGGRDGLRRSAARARALMVYSVYSVYSVYNPVYTSFPFSGRFGNMFGFGPLRAQMFPGAESISGKMCSAVQCKVRGKRESLPTRRS